ncbi:hypothetical protein [Falsibacillus albus]|nr:hypothetical protein [Falsibacillus albus]
MFINETKLRMAVLEQMNQDSFKEHRQGHFLLNYSIAIAGIIFLILFN